MTEFKKIIIASVLAIALGLTFLIIGANLPKTAGFLPRILGVLLIFLAILMVYEANYKEKNAVKAKRRIDERSEEDDDQEEDLIKIDYKKAFIFGLMIASYIFTMKLIGYFIVTPLFIISAYRYLKSTTWRNTIIVSIGFTIFVYALFVVFLKLPVPMGLLG